MKRSLFIYLKKYFWNMIDINFFSDQWTVKSLSKQKFNVLVDDHIGTST